MKTLVSKRLVKRLTCIFLITTFIGCSQNSLKSDELNVVAIETKEDSDSNNKNLQETKGLKIIKSAEAKYKVKSVKKTTALIKILATKYHGYISDLQFQNNLQSIENNFTIKVPQEYFDAIMDSIDRNIAFINYENITTKDVTETYIDLETRLKTKNEIKKRYEVILRKNQKQLKIFYSPKKN